LDYLDNIIPVNSLMIDLQDRQQKDGSDTEKRD